MSAPLVSKVFSVVDCVPTRLLSARGTPADGVANESRTPRGPGPLRAGLYRGMDRIACCGRGRQGSLTRLATAMCG